MSIYSNLLKHDSEKNYRIYRGVVYSVETDPYTELKTIWIKEEGAADEPPFTEALPPAIMPIDPMGSGVVSMPMPGTHCLVVEGELGNSVLSRAQILTYLPERGIRHEGTQSPDTLEDGDFMIKLGGRNANRFTMTKAGEISLFNSSWANFTIDGSIQRIKSESKRFRRKNAVGLYQNEHIEFDPLNPVVYERTSHTSSFGLKYESPVDSDALLDTEEAAIIPLLNPYVNKAVVRAGKVPNKKQLLQDSATHPYTIDTRSSSLNSYYKDAVTRLELGWQGGHYPYGGGLHHRSPGNLIHWSAKRNAPGNVGSFLFRYGKLEHDSGMKAPLAPAATALPEEMTKGEVFRQQIYQGINFGVPLGIPIIDPVGEGKGYSTGEETSSMQAYVTSMGKLESPLLLADPTFGSLYRRRLHDQLISGTGFYSTEHIGGQGAIPGGIEPDYHFREMAAKVGGVATDMMTERFGKTLATGGYDYTLKLEDQLVQNSTELKMSPLETKLENITLGGVSTSSLVFDHTAQKITLGNAFPVASNFLEVGPSSVTISSVDGAASITVDGLAGTIVLEGKTPVVGMPSNKLEISPTGVTVNGVGLATSNFVDWMIQNAGFISLGPMGPNAISPAALPILMSMGNIMTWMPGVGTQGFRTG